MATAEFAVALPAVILLLVLALSALQLGFSSVQCADAARVGARELARGESVASAISAASHASPGGAHIDVSHDNEWVTVTVSAPAPRALRLIGVADARSRSSARTEGASP